MTVAVLTMAVLTMAVLTTAVLAMASLTTAYLFEGDDQLLILGRDPRLTLRAVDRPRQPLRPQHVRS